MRQQSNVLKVSLVILILLGFGAYVVYSLNSEEFHAMREATRQAREATQELLDSTEALLRQQSELKKKTRTSEPPSPANAQPEWPKADLTQRPHLELLSSEASSNSFSMTITGKIKNNHVQKTYTFVQVLFDVYDSSGNRVGSAVGNINNLGPLETWRFKAVYFGADGYRFRLDEITGF